MNKLCQWLWALLCAATLTAGHACAASTTDFTDQWWVANESGWGLSVQQQGDVLFVAVYVYETNRAPTWFTASAYLKSDAPPGHQVFTGDLYLTNGPYFGNDFTTSAPVTYVKVGSLTFDATGTSDAVLTYNVYGTQVTNNVTRQTWRYENLTGKYYGWWHWECASSALVNDMPTAMTITHNDATNAVEILAEDAPPPPLGYFLLKGSYSQSGRMGQVVAELQPTDHGTVTFFEIEKSASGFVGRFSGTINGCQVTNGRMSGVLR